MAVPAGNSKNFQLTTFFYHLAGRLNKDWHLEMFNFLRHISTLYALLDILSPCLK